MRGDTHTDTQTEREREGERETDRRERTCDCGNASVFCVERDREHIESVHL